MEEVDILLLRVLVQQRPSAHTTKELFWIRVLTRPMLDLDETTLPWPRSLLVLEGRPGSASELILIHGNPPCNGYGRYFNDQKVGFV
jgi:hypothetical protein